MAESGGWNNRIMGSKTLGIYRSLLSNLSYTVKSFFAPFSQLYFSITAHRLVRSPIFFSIT